MFLIVYSSFFFASSTWTLPQKIPQITFLCEGHQLCRTLDVRQAGDIQGMCWCLSDATLPHTPMWWLGFLLSFEWQSCPGVVFKVALAKCSPKGKNPNIYVLWQKRVFVESQGSCCRWGAGLWGGEREGTQNTKFCLFYGPCCPSAVWVMEKAHECRAEQKSAWAYGVVNSLDIRSELVPLLFHSCFIVCCSGVLSVWIHLSSFHQ